ncbi:hypothetical protein ACFY8W_23710 [Streptomyces sp. NPDC012637]|uniref:hypothetical protein n=1 Tax=Streptomyces sp. NPDC012637 TaxID=3364842 RepID=UPI0036E217D2
MGVHLRRVTVVGALLTAGAATAPAAYADSAPSVPIAHTSSDWGEILYPDNPASREQIGQKINSIKSQLGTMGDNTNAAVEIADDVLDFATSPIPKGNISDANQVLNDLAPIQKG